MIVQASRTQESEPANHGSRVLEFDKIDKDFVTPQGDRLRVLDDISFSVLENSFSALVGPSGCGKTTLFKLATGLETATRGETRYRGEAVRRVNSNIGYVTQEATLFPWYTLRQNVEFPLKIRNVSTKERVTRVAAFLELAKLSGFEDHYPHQLSGGMQKRASIIRTLIYEPKVILMDEPFGALDAQTRMLMQDDLLRLWHEHQTTILFITHDISEAITLGDEVILLTRQPTQIKATVPVDVLRPRNVFKPHQMDGYLQTYEKVWDLFRSEVIPDDSAAG